MQTIVKQITLTGTAIVLTTADFTEAVVPGGRCAMLHFEPDSANTHVCKVGDAAANVIRQLAKPTAADAVLDQYDVSPKTGHNVVELAQFSVNGTNTEKINVTAYVI